MVVMLKKILLFTLVLLQLFSVMSVTAFAETANATTEVYLSDQTVTTFGRTYYTNRTLHFNWTNSGFQFTFVGTAVSGVFGANNSVSAGTFLKVYVDDQAPVTIELQNRSSQTVVLAENLPNTKHTVRVVKRSENVWGGTATASKLLVTGMMGTPPQNATRKIEVVGDSITCGFGNMVTAATAAGGYQSKEEDGTATYATLAASYFGADCSVIARSGIGFSCDSAGNKSLLMGQVYGYTDYLSGGGSSSPAWDFAANPSDVVILALGTNDTANGDAADYETKAREMLSLVRQNNPNAHIIWAYGMMTDSRSNLLRQIIKEANDQGDSKVYYHALTHMGSITDGVGGGGHPGPASHVYNSKYLADTIAKVTGWSTVVPVTVEETLPTALYDGETLAGTSAAFNTTLSLDSNHTQGTTSLKMDYPLATGQTNSVGGMAFLQFGDGVDLSKAQSITFDLYISEALSGSQGFQVNFATAGQDGFNHMVVLNNAAAGWHSVVINPKSIAAVNSTADWKAIKQIRLTWMNYAQNGPRYFLLDNLQYSTGKSTSRQLPYEQPATVVDPDVEAAEQVIAMIAALNATDATAAASARSAYEGLTALQQALVTNLAKLEQVEEALQNQPTVLYGDVDGNGVVSAADALEVLKSVVGKVTLTEGQTKASDVDGSGKADAADALDILKKVVGKIDKFDVET